METANTISFAKLLRSTSESDSSIDFTGAAELFEVRTSSVIHKVRAARLLRYPGYQTMSSGRPVSSSSVDWTLRLNSRLKVAIIPISEDLHYRLEKFNTCRRIADTILWTNEI